ncbi:hypothetical protein QYE76_022063 [Lolium multiflorum]|uniref:Retrotransposon gag domain-containing protein n=1 Tax=Lolium multiflorum TaxID=4521 RepID=A0AAD8R925_LOLMU|nr:hypothetical protein QYE76_022063 [Lolium multiflorum]
MKKVAELLKKKDEEIDINYVRKLVASAMQQQSKADTSRRLESNPDHCVSTAQKDALGNQHRDGESRTGSTERRRHAREHPNPIPVPSDSTPRDPAKGKGPMYAGKDKHRTHHHHSGFRVLRCRLIDAVLPETPGPMGPVESTSATTCRRQGTGAGTKTASLNLAGAVMKAANPSLEEAGTKSARLSPAGAGTTEATVTKRKVATEAGASRGKNAGNLRAEAKNLTGPLADLPRHHPVEAEVEAEAGARGRTPGSRITTMHLRRRNPNIACRMLQLYLIGPARVWLSDLEENSIFCWYDLKKAFENHFRGTYKRPATTSDLQACIQKKGETSRSFLTRWLATRNECENVDNRTAMHAFIGGLQRGGLLRHKLTCLVNANKLTLDEMINIASDHTAADGDAGGDLVATAIPVHQQKKNRDNGVSNNNKRKDPSEDQKGGGSYMVAMTFQRGGPEGGRCRGRGGGAGRGQQRADKVTVVGSRAPQTYEEYRI